MRTNPESFFYLIPGELICMIAKSTLSGCINYNVVNCFRHPDLHSDEIIAIRAMFDGAKEKGWLS